MKIAIVGPYPPPLGGISIHVQRLILELKKRSLAVIPFYNLNARKWLIAAWTNWRSFDLVHFHDIHWIDRVIIGLLGKLGINTILTIHGDSLKTQLESLRGFQAKLFTYCLRFITHFIVVKPEIRDLLISSGICESKISIIQSFLPPSSCPEDYQNLPSETRQFIANHDPLIIGNAFQMVPYLDEDLYGIVFTSELCLSLIKDYPNIGFIFFLGKIGNERLWNQLKNNLKQKSIVKHFHFVLGQPLVSALPNANVFIRPSYKDGFGVSIAEALYLGVPAVASDVCPRPAGTILFKTGDLRDFEDKVRWVLSHASEAVESTKKAELPDNAEAIIQVYQSVINKSLENQVYKRSELH